MKVNRLLSFDAWANRETLSSLRAANDPPQKAIGWLAHIVAAEWLWYERITGAEQSVPVWPEWNLDEIGERGSAIAEKWTALLPSIAERMSDSITYRNSKGETFTSAIEDILTHVTMHGVHHRGQIASAMRSSGLSPAYTDFIHATRNNLL